MNDTYALKLLIREAIVSKRVSRSKIGVKNTAVRLRSHERLAHSIHDDVQNIVTNAYAKIGGHAKTNTATALADEYPDWFVADTDAEPDVDVFIGGSPRAGKEKLGVSGSDGSPEAKQFLLNLKKRLLTHGWWAEVSGATAHIAINKQHIPFVNSEHKVRSLLPGKDITWHGEHPDGLFPGTDGWYSRSIGGQQHVKIIVGDI